MEINRNATRIINGMAHTVTTINGMDRVQINLRLQHLSEEMNKLKAKRDRMLAMSDALDRECEMQERAENANNLFDEMFGG
jgi:hypothetical protein